MIGTVVSEHPTMLALVAGVLMLLVLGLTAWAVRRVERGDREGLDLGGLVRSWRRVEYRALGRSFSGMLRGLRVGVPGPDWRYTAPWVLLLGSAGSGKSALAHAIDLNRPFALPVDPLLAEEGCAWHVFEQGVVLEPATAVVWGSNGEQDGGGWRRLLNQLLRHRGERGLDGVVVTLSCADLTGPAALDTVALAAQLRRLRERLRQAQQYLGLRLPVYLVITRCDSVPGFSAFWQPLAAERSREIFGWSSDAALTTLFSTHLIVRAFEEIGHDVHRTLLGIAVKADALDAKAFQFPAEFQKLGGAVASAAEQLFHTDTWQEPHFFRGVYFTGAAGVREAVGAPVVPAVVEDDGADLAEVPVVDAAVSPVMPGVLFVTDLFDTKIFRESPVVKPARGGLVVRGRAVRSLQALLVGAMIVLTLGAGMSYESLRLAVPKIMAPLALVEQTGERVRGVQGRDATGMPVSPRAVHDAAEPLLISFKQLGNRSLVEPFIPSSWFSSIENRVKVQLVHSFELAVLAPMHDALIERMEALIAPDNAHLDNAHNDAPSGVLEGAGSLSSRANREREAFDRLGDYVNALSVLNEEVQTFNVIESYNDSSHDEQARARLARDFPVLAHSLLGLTLGDALNTQGDLFADVMKLAHVDHIDTEAYRERASAKLLGLAENAARLISGDGPVAALFQRMGEDIRRLSTARFADPTEARTALQHLRDTLNIGEQVLGDKNMHWLFVLHPEADPHWRKLMAMIRGNSILIPSAAKDVHRVMSAKVVDLRAALLAVRAPGSDPLLVVGDTDSDGELRLAPVLAGLRKALPGVLASDFMVATVAGRPLQPVSASTILLWLPEPLGRVVTYNQSFEAAMAGPVATIGPPMRSLVQAASASVLQGAMLTAFAEAEVIERRGPDFRDVVDEPLLTREVQTFQTAAPALTLGLDALARRGFDQARGAVTGVLRQHLDAMLERIDALAEDGTPYLPVDQFRGWDGVLPLNFDGYQVLSDAELRQYLTGVRERLEGLGSRLAFPLITFIRGDTAPATAGGASPPTASVRGDLMPVALRNHPTVAKWSGILGELERYKARNPGSTLASLEQFIRFDLLSLKPETCLQVLTGLPVADTGDEPQKPLTRTVYEGNDQGGDFFLQRRERVRRMAVVQCQRYSGQSVRSDYGRLAGEFNDTLAGRYPFADGRNADGAEASPDVVAGFLQRFSAVEPQLRRGLGRPTPGSATARALDFVNRIAETRDFLAPFVVPPGGGGGAAAAPAFDVDVEFRVNRPRETGANQIIEWTFAAGDQTLQRGGEGRTVTWRPGDPVAVTLRWAKDAPVEPVAIVGAEGADASVTPERAIVFSYNNRWSLLRLLQLHRAPAVDLPGMTDRHPHTLKFAAATGSVAVAGAAVPPLPLLMARTNVFLRIVLSSLDGEGKARRFHLLPTFPYIAPRLEPSP